MAAWLVSKTLGSETKFGDESVDSEIVWAEAPGFQKITFSPNCTWRGSKAALKPKG